MSNLQMSQPPGQGWEAACPLRAEEWGWSRSERVPPEPETDQAKEELDTTSISAGINARLQHKVKDLAVNFFARYLR